MVKHVILWKLKDSYEADEKEQIKADIKAGLEGLAGKIPGLLRNKNECYYIVAYVKKVFPYQADASR